MIEEMCNGQREINVEPDCRWCLNPDTPMKKERKNQVIGDVFAF